MSTCACAVFTFEVFPEAEARAQSRLLRPPDASVWLVTLQVAFMRLQPCGMLTAFGVYIILAGRSGLWFTSFTADVL